MELLLLDPESDRFVASSVWFRAKFRENKLILGIYGADHRGRGFCDPLTPQHSGMPEPGTVHISFLEKKKY